MCIRDRYNSEKLKIYNEVVFCVNYKCEEFKIYSYVLFCVNYKCEKFKVYTYVVFCVNYVVYVLFCSLLDVHHSILKLLNKIFNEKMVYMRDYKV